MKRLLLTAFAVLLGILLCVQTSQAATITLFEDTFSNTTIDTTKWTEDIAGGSVLIENYTAKFYIQKGRAYLQSNPFSINEWDRIDFSGQWAIPSAITPEYDIFVYNADDTSEYLRVTYRSWDGPNLWLRDAGDSINTTKYYETRTPPSTLTDFSLWFTGTTWGYTEGPFSQSFASTTLADAENFYIKIGGWDASNTANQIVYFDNITVTAEAAAAPLPPAALLLCTGLCCLVLVRRKRMRV